MLWEKEYINCLYIFSPFLSLYFRDNLCRSLKFVIAGLHYPYHMPFYLTIRENSLTIYEGIIQKKVNKAEV